MNMYKYELRMYGRSQYGGGHNMSADFRWSNFKLPYFKIGF